MDNLRHVIKILFRYVSPEEVLNQKVHYDDDINRDSFMVLANTYMPHYSNNEIKNMVDFLRSEFEWHHSKQQGKNFHGKPNVFDAIILFADKVLIEDNHEPQCKYEHLLRWREMVVSLDEDLFVTAFLAYEDLLSTHGKRAFFWPPVISHNNNELRQVLAQGVAENHFHLKGSSPTFQLSWISMMNDVVNPKFKEVFDQYDRRRLSVGIKYRVEYKNETMYNQYLQAALLRLYFFCYLKNDFFSLTGEGEDESGSRKFGHAEMRRQVARFLDDPDDMKCYLSEIQQKIEMAREQYAGSGLDYTLWSPELRENKKDHLNELISGERWLLYEMYKRAYARDRGFAAWLGDWFYAYLLIKEKIRAELIQTNGNVGFDNFYLYQDRKESFIEDTAFEKPYLRMAVKDTICNQHIRKLEARITPKNTSAEMERMIQKYDGAILERESTEKARENLKDRYFYVCHFIKEPDDALDDEVLGDAECRHYRKRQEVRKQAMAIYSFRKKRADLAKRIRGIDAASKEIGCRPEVFAQAFRFLKGQSAYYYDPENGDRVEIADLRITYHVGEDFLDLVDGLRAIDEAISFLDMGCNDRLGHALALGVDVDTWYEAKSQRILISQMDYLDNLVWLYGKIRKYHIPGCEDTMHYIEKKYDEYFRAVYLNHIPRGYAESVFYCAAEYFEEHGIQNNYNNFQRYYSINTYYDSWKLRGDDPEYFRDGYFKLSGGFGSEWDRYGVNKEFPENYRIRYNPEAAFLYHVYHYLYEVKRAGNIKREIKVHPCIIDAVKKVQKKFQWIIVQRGIAIETNPSSNALIGTFKRYDRHPILNWYNTGLATSTEEAQGVPQIQVSINTDDQGVFATYIENEYAYLALALEKLRNPDGNPRYSRTLIYQWLDNVRKMGLVQSFESCDIQGS